MASSRFPVFFLLSVIFRLSGCSAYNIPSLRHRATYNKTIWTAGQKCPTGDFVFGMALSLKKNSVQKIDLHCGSREIISANTPGEHLSGSLKMCGDNGLAVGYQLKRSELKGILTVMLYCDDHTSTIGGLSIDRGIWDAPLMCGWGEALCGFQAQLAGQDYHQMKTMKMMCCPVPELIASFENHGWKDYRAISGKLIYLQDIGQQWHMEKENTIYDHYFENELDHPYYFKWKFCPLQTYVAGLQLQNGKRDLHLSCSDSTSSILEQIDGTGIATSEWNTNEQSLSGVGKCDGVAIGMQVRYHETSGIQAIRMFCSFSETKEQLSYVEGEFENIDASVDYEGEWQKAKLCDRNQAICGFKSLTNRNNRLDHFKVKCCDVPDITEVCFPGDKYELLVECDATLAHAETSCTYTKSEGVTISTGKNQGERKDEQFHKSLANEWVVTEGTSERESEGATQGNILTWSNGTSNSKTQNSNQGQSTQNSTGTSKGSSGGVATVDASGQIKTSSNTSSSGQFNDFSIGFNSLSSVGGFSGSGQSFNKGNVVGSSVQRGQSSSRGTSRGGSKSHTNGISKGHVSAHTKGTSNSQTVGQTTGQSESHQSGSSSSDSKSISGSATVSVGKSVSAHAGYSGFGASAGLETTITAGFSATLGGESQWSSSKQTSDTSEKSKQINMQSGSENTEQQSNTINSETSDTNSATLTLDDRQDSSQTYGSELNQQATRGHTRESNSQRNHNFQAGRTGSIGTRNSLDVSNQNVDSISQDQSQTKSNTSSVDVNQSNQYTRTIELGQSKSNSTNSEVQSQKSSTIQKDRSKDKNISGSQSRNLNNGTTFTTGYDWSSTSSDTYNVVRSYEVRISVPPGIRARLYQVVGYCAQYRIKTSMYKRVDFRSDVGLCPSPN